MEGNNNENATSILNNGGKDGGAAVVDKVLLLFKCTITITFLLMVSTLVMLTPGN